MVENHLAHIINNRAAKYQNKTAYKFKNGDTYESTSWITFKNKINHIAHFLISEEIKPFANIGIYSQNYPEWTISDIAILSTRAVSVPIYATSTYLQLKYIVQETEMEIIFVGDNMQLKNAIKALGECSSLKKVVTFSCDKNTNEKVVRIEDLLSKAYEPNISESLKLRLTEASTDDLATIIYTSGTTGEPKGVMLNHSNFITLLETHKERLVLNEKDVSMVFLPLSHIFERAWTYFVLFSGATNMYNLYPKNIIDELPLVKPTVMCAVPRFFEKTYEGITQTASTWGKAQKSIFNWAKNIGLQYIEYEKDNKKAPLGLSLKRSIADALVMKKLRKVFGGNIKYMPCAGAALDMEILKFFHAMGLKVNYGYGATETTATVSCMRSDKFDFKYTGSIMPKVEVKINEDDGMILIKGPTVFHGYYKKPKETAESLIDGWYYSGDQGSIPEDGILLMKERIKDIIKTSTGKYISPQKIELLLSKSEYIEQLCVIGDNRKYLTVIIVPAYDIIRKKMKFNAEELNTNELLINNSKVLQLMQDSIDTLQVDSPPFEKVIKFHLLAEPFSIGNSLLTNSMKIRRKQVNKVYSEAIKNMY